MSSQRIYKKKFPKGSYLGQKYDGYPLNEITYHNLIRIKSLVINKNMDYTFCIDGSVGSGKSTLAVQLALALDPTFCLERVTFTPTQFMYALQKAEKGQAVMFDEAMILSSRSAMSVWNKQIISIMSQIRSKNLFIFFILPSIFDLDRNLALYRIKMLFHCYFTSDYRRGRYDVYFNSKTSNLKNLYITGKKFYSYSLQKANYRGDFSSLFCLNEKEYEIKKQKAIGDIGSISKVSVGMTPMSKKQQLQRDKLIRHLHYKLDLRFCDIARITGDLSAKTVGHICKLNDNYDIVPDPEENNRKNRDY